VGEWLGGAPLRAEVERLISHHETGDGVADLLQAADSLSFLEVNAGRALAWVQEGRCDLAQAQAKLDWMRDRIRVDAARDEAERLHRRASRTLAADRST
jgi:Ser/Thr protein kinase RdoA (MazF antagonist)